ncbi:hypothetical protein C6A85_48665, partial [Mycobacterium sp. ITM-2017-0098]
MGVAGLVGQRLDVDGVSPRGRHPRACGHCSGRPRLLHRLCPERGTGHRTQHRHCVIRTRRRRPGHG